MINAMKFTLSVMVFILVIIYIAPIIWLVMVSLKTEVDIFSLPPKIFFQPQFEHYRNLFADDQIINYLKNSLIISLTTTAIAVFTGSLAAYACARFSSLLTKGFILGLFLLRMLPAIAVAVPIYLIAVKTGLLDNYFTLIMVHICVVIPIVVLMMQNCFLEIPPSLEESAMVDGCSRLQGFFWISLPLAAPGLVATAIFAFIMSWNEFLFALILSGRYTQTLPVGVMKFFADRVTMWGEVAAMGVLMILPAAVFTFFVQKYLVKGLTMGALKE